VSCHDPKSADQKPGTAKYKYTDVKSDSTYADGQLAPFYGKELFSDVLAPWLRRIKEGAYAREKVTPEEQALFEEGRLNIFWEKPRGNAIQAMPLYGIWASPPYLHNGSVRSIRELLTPPSQRAQAFNVGSLEYEPEDLGFKDEPTYYGSVLDATKSGNGSWGHEAGTSLSSDDKDRLIEFLKVYQPEGMKTF
jgi:hypothetical protein